MKYYITGTKRGLGKALSEKYDTVDTIYECDVFINCKHDGFQQVELLYKVAELNKKIGEDVSIITFDGPVVESLTNPKLTAVSHPLEELGTNAINILLGTEKKNQFSNYLVKPHIIERGSVKSLI